MAKMDENKIVIYQTEDGQTQIDVRLENETVWLTQAQMAELFQKDRTVITRHINNVFKEYHSTWCHRRETTNTRDCSI